MATATHTTPLGVNASGLPATPPLAELFPSRKKLPAAPPHIEPLQFLQGLPAARLRRRIEAAVERLLAVLDALDGDPDLEDGDDAEQDAADGEPWLGWTAHMNQAAPDRCDGSDRELDLSPCLTGEAA